MGIREETPERPPILPVGTLRVAPHLENPDFSSSAKGSGPAADKESHSTGNPIRPAKRERLPHHINVYVYSSY